MSLLRTMREILIFSLPMIIGEIGQIMFGIGDVFVAGHYSTEVLAALGVACGFFFPFIILGVGIMYAVSPTKAHWIAEERCVKVFPGSSLTIALLTGGILTATLLVLTLFIPVFGINPELEGLVQTYLGICSFSIIPALVFAAIKENLLAYDKTVVPNAIILLFNVFNIIANIFFMFTLSLGITGAALATLLSRTLMAVSLYFYARRTIHFKFSLSWDLVISLVKKGIPIGLGNLASGLIFAVVIILVGKMSVLASAANNIIIQLTSLTYMIPCTLASVVAVKVGRATGEKDLDAVRRYSFATIALGVSISSIMALCFLCFPELLLKTATTDLNVVKYGTALLVYVAIFQIPDSIQAIVLGSLRGMGKVKLPAVVGAVCIWLIGLPAGSYLAYSKGMEASGLWAGLAVGLTAMGISLIVIFLRHMRAPVQY